MSNITPTVDEPRTIRVGQEATNENLFDTIVNNADKFRDGSIRFIGPTVAVDMGGLSRQFFMQAGEHLLTRLSVNSEGFATIPSSPVDIKFWNGAGKFIACALSTKIIPGIVFSHSILYAIINQVFVDIPLPHLIWLSLLDDRVYTERMIQTIINDDTLATMSYVEVGNDMRLTGALERFADKTDLTRSEIAELKDLRWEWLRRVLYFSALVVIIKT